MSYDIRLVIDTGGEFPASVTETNSPTYNLSEMFNLALGRPIRELDGQLASDVIPVLRTAIAAMEDKPEKFKKLNPANGWGSYSGALDSLRWLLEQCLQHPKSTVKI